MAADGHLNFDTEINEKGFSSGITKLGGIAKNGLSILSGAIAGVSAAMGAGVAAGVKYNAGIEQYQTSFEVMTGSADQAAQIIENLKKVGAETPFELNDLADTTQLLMNYGMTADDAQSKMMMLGDISQGSADKMNRIATAYGQMSSAGKVQLEDVKQMIEAGFNPLQEISESTGESMASLYDRISKGTLSVDEITQSMTRATAEGGKYYQSMEKQSQTVSGMISTLKDNAQQLLGEVVKPISDSIASELLPSAIAAIEQLTTAFKEDGVDGLIEAGAQIISNVVLGIAQKLPDVITMAVNLINTIVASINENLPQLLNAGGQILSALGSGIMQLLPTLMELAVQLIQSFVMYIAENLPAVLAAGAQIVSMLIQGIAQVLPTLAEAALSLIASLIEGLNTGLPQILQQATDMFSQFCTRISEQGPTLIEKGVEVITNLLSGLVSAAPQILEMAGNMLNDFVSAILDMLPSILDSGVKMITSLLDGIVDKLPDFISKAGEMIADFAKNIGEHLPEILQKGIELIGKLAAGIIKAVPDLIGKIPEIIGNLADAFFEVDWLELGGNIIKGIANGIINAAGAIWDALVGVVSSAWDGICDWLGIASPSKKARDIIGKNWALGIGVGFEKYMPDTDMQKDVESAMDLVNKRVFAVESAPVAGQSNVRQQSAVAYQSREEIDYKRLGEETAKAMEGVAVNMDGKSVGSVVTPYVSNNEYLNVARRRR